MRHIIFFILILCASPEIAISLEEKSSTTSSKDEKYSLLLPVIDGQLSALRKGDVDKAYQEYTAEDFRKVTTLEQFKRFVEKYPVLAKNKTFQFQSLYFEDHIGTFQGALISTDGQELQTEFDLVEENGKWKVIGIQLFKPESAMLRQEK